MPILEDSLHQESRDPEDCNTFGKRKRALIFPPPETKILRLRPFTPSTGEGTNIPGRQSPWGMYTWTNSLMLWGSSRYIPKYVLQTDRVGDSKQRGINVGSGLGVPGWKQDGSRSYNHRKRIRDPTRLSCPIFLIYWQGNGAWRGKQLAKGPTCLLKVDGTSPVSPAPSPHPHPADPQRTRILARQNKGLGSLENKIPQNRPNILKMKSTR